MLEVGGIFADAKPRETAGVWTMNPTLQSFAVIAAVASSMLALAGPARAF